MTTPYTKPIAGAPGTMSLASTASTAEIYARLRLLLLQYIGPGGDRLIDYLGDERVYVRATPEPVVFPYITMRASRLSDAAYNGYRETMSLEVQCIGRPESQLPLVESAMDLVDQCLTSIADTVSGVMVCRGRTRQTIPQMSDPADAAVVGVIGTYEFFLWPVVLTSRA